MKNNKSDPENEKDRFEVGDGTVSRRTPGANYEFNYSKNKAHKRESLKTKDRKIARLRAEEFCRLRRTDEEAGIRKRISMSEAKENSSIRVRSPVARRRQRPSTALRSTPSSRSRAVAASASWIRSRLRSLTITAAGVPNR